uniref:Uncharacterized protein n=1 Tax=Anas zonorhyncha TaxID=75864 RepID=A0A8B9URK2_9AVES
LGAAGALSTHRSLHRHNFHTPPKPLMAKGAELELLHLPELQISWARGCQDLHRDSSDIDDLSQHSPASSPREQGAPPPNRVTHAGSG